jgi:hypothetical protein
MPLNSLVPEPRNDTLVPKMDMNAVERELDAMKEVANILEALSPEAQRRVLTWVNSFLSTTTF